MPDQVSLSEPHNFGRTVFRSQSGRIVKPRPLFWEWLLYSKNPVRLILDEISAAKAFPELTFSGDLPNGGSVDCLKLFPQSSNSLDELNSIGSAIAIYAFFGIGDLHFENILFGSNAKGEFRFCSIDIESVLNDFSDAGQTGLLPTVRTPLTSCGLKHIILRPDSVDNLAVAAALAEGYIRTLSNLFKIEIKIWNAVTLLLNSRPVAIRIIARKTLSYVRYLNSQTAPTQPESPLCDPELRQLARGDVPYFFRWSNSSKLLEWSLPDTEGNVDEVLRSQFRFPSERILEKASITPRKFGKELLERGALQILRAFVNSAEPSKRGQFKSVKVRTKEGKIYLNTSDMNLSCEPRSPY